MTKNLSDLHNKRKFDKIVPFDLKVITECDIGFLLHVASSMDGNFDVDDLNEKWDNVEIASNPFFSKESVYDKLR